MGWKCHLLPSACLCLDFAFQPHYLKSQNNPLAEPQAERECSKPALLISNPLPVPQRAAVNVSVTYSLNHLGHSSMHMTLLPSHMLLQGHHTGRGQSHGAMYRKEHQHVPYIRILACHLKIGFLDFSLKRPIIKWYIQQNF